MFTITSMITATTLMIDEFFLRIALAGVGVALAAGPLGCFVLWRRMVYFGDTISHASLLGIAFALALNLPMFIGVLLCATGISLVVIGTERRFHHADILLGVAAHSALALGLVAISLLEESVQVDLMGLLVGDILSVNWWDVGVIWTGALLALALLIWRWRPLLMSSLDREMALAHGADPKRESILFTLALAVLVAVAIKVVGALLITALLIIPAATARFGATTPERMAMLAALIGVGSALLGLFGSFAIDTPTGPSIVVAALMMLIVGSLLRTIVDRKLSK